MLCFANVAPSAARRPQGHTTRDGLSQDSDPQPLLCPLREVRGWYLNWDRRMWRN